MDNITHSLAGALLGQMGLKKSSRFGLLGCILGANAPDIDVFAPLFLPVDNIAFHRGPTHALLFIPLMAGATVGLLWLLDRFWRRPGAEPFRAWPLFLAVLLATFSHPFLDWLTTYAVNLYLPFDRGWYSGNAIFIIDLVYWVLLVAGVTWSSRRWRKGQAHPGRPAIVAGLLMLAYIAGNLVWSMRAERLTHDALIAQGITPTLVVASPPPIAFWERTMAWRSATEWGGGRFGPSGLALDPARAPLGLDNPVFLRAKAARRSVRSFLYWSRMPIVVEVEGRLYLSDQRYFGPIRSAALPPAFRRAARRASFLVPLDTP
jgi:inner membrane protein